MHLLVFYILLRGNIAKYSHNLSLRQSPADSMVIHTQMHLWLWVEGAILRPKKPEKPNRKSEKIRPKNFRFGLTFFLFTLGNENFYAPRFSERKIPEKTAINRKCNFIGLLYLWLPDKKQ
ncbi:hypothetical protein HR17_09085 [Porphyromonas gulae]|nr:hypothetical protein HR17_09085 [Porphyromonas gulae]KGO05229.1 hypothetical protein HR16_01060 [Porphyromonas gulae]